MPPRTSNEEYARIVRQGYRNLLRSLPKPLSDEDRRMIRDALDLAAEAHRHQVRMTGEPYITHPIAVAQICAEEIGLGPTAVACALLHDVVEDTSVSLEMIRERFGERVALIVEGLTKLDEEKDDKYAGERQAINLTHVMRAMLVDVRVILIKMADRLHNLRTIKGMPPEKQQRIVIETDSIYTPLAHRLGLYNIKTEFQDIYLKIIHPEKYREIADKLAQTKRSREQYIRDFIRPIEEALHKQLKGIKFRILGRPKSIYSIWNKMCQKEVAFEDIYDLFAIRIILDVPFEEERMACWMVYAIVTSIYQNIPARQKDWITTPKANGYESLHTSVIGPGGKYVEVQIRTERMNDIAERGYAAHWKYKGLKLLNRNENTFEKWFDRIREVLENNTASAKEIMVAFEDEILEEEVHVLTPKGESRFLKEGATALDFAFDIHSDIGCTCRIIRVNGAVVPFNYVLKNGDQVSVETDKNARPTPDWLKYVTTSKAKNRIRAALKKERFKMAADGLEILERKVQRLFNCSAEPYVEALAKWYGFDQRLEFLVAIALQQVDLLRLKEIRLENGKIEPIVQLNASPDAQKPQEPTTTVKPNAAPTDIIINDEPGHLYSYVLASCCTPLPGDAIFAYITSRENVAKIHRESCPNATYLKRNYSYRIFPARWGNVAQFHFVAAIAVKGIDQGPGTIQRLSDHISSMGINIRSFSIAGDRGYFSGRIELIVASNAQLQQVTKEIRKLKFVTSVERIE
ncbi:MAG: RelA/SpoT family protein [Saprospiraceae bacterium]|nr:RelA/SpoT family protein [Saprospiraceae bacterium]MDW8484114.1 RelA/SpoT family protein [Saprospiraceae bacterium]